MSVETIEREIPYQRNTTRPQRNYSDADKAKALTVLDLNGGNAYKTAQTLGIPRPTLVEWQKGRINQSVSETRQRETEALADKCERAANLFADQAISTVDAAKGTNAATGMAIFVDKMRLLRGESTVITESKDKAITTLVNVLREHQAYYSQYPDAQPTPAEYYQNIVIAIAPNADPVEVLEQAKKMLTQ